MSDQGMQDLLQRRLIGRSQIEDLVVVPIFAVGAALILGALVMLATDVDLPTIGPRTFMLAAEAGFDAVVIETGGVIVLDQPQCVAIADAMGIAFWVRDRGGAP